MTVPEQVAVTETRRGSGLKYLHGLQEDLSNEAGYSQAASVAGWLATFLYPSDPDDENPRDMHWTLCKWTYPDGRWRYHLEIRIDGGDVIEIKSGLDV